MFSRFVSTAAAVLTLVLLGSTSGCDAPGPSSGPVELADVPSQFLDFGGVQVHWKTHGSGEPALLYVPGWGSDHTVWSEQAKLPPADRRSIYVDLPGHGESDAPERDYVTVRDADGLEAMIAELTAAGSFALDTETTSLFPIDAKLVGLSFSVKGEHRPRRPRARPRSTGRSC